RVHLLLFLDVLDDGLHDDIAASQVFFFRGPLEAASDRLRRFLDGSLLSEFGQRFSIAANPCSRNFCSTSRTVTSNPAVAATCAMPEPMSPQPKTPTFFTSITPSF